MNWAKLLDTKSILRNQRIPVQHQQNCRNRNQEKNPDIAFAGFSTLIFDIATRTIKYLGINLTKEVKDLYSENYTTLRKKLGKTQTNGSMYHAHGLEE